MLLFVRVCISPRTPPTTVTLMVTMTMMTTTTTMSTTATTAATSMTTMTTEVMSRQITVTVPFVITVDVAFAQAMMLFLAFVVVVETLGFLSSRPGSSTGSGG